MTELAETVARDNFYQTLLDESKRIAAAIKQGNPDIIRAAEGRPYFLKTITTLLVNLPNQEISKVPLSLKSGLPETIYKSPTRWLFNSALC